jgi:hypothetical protein
VKIKFGVDKRRQKIQAWKEKFFERDFYAVSNQSMSNVVVPKYIEVEELLVQYTLFRMDRYKQDKCGLSYALLRQKAHEVAAKVLVGETLSSFEASNGWIQKVLHRHNILGLRLHGEANEVSEQEAEENMDLFRNELYYLMSTWNVDPERVFNAEQTGLFYQKLPNRVYCKKYMAGSVRGSKIMREKARFRSNHL